jgi:hypothetical protein
MSTSHIVRSFHSAFISTLVLALVSMTGFFMFEPSVGRAIGDTFTVTQLISDEISFLTNPADVVMMDGAGNGYLGGLTGGYATGTTRIVISSNDAQGYNMTLSFVDNPTAHSMAASSTAWINDYTPAVAGVPDYNWIDNPIGGSAEFGYTVRASTTGIVNQSFRSDGSTCNTSSVETDNKCWLNPTTTAKTIVTSTGASLSSTTTIKFKVMIPDSPSPSLPTGFYIATGTLTALNNP